MAKLVKSAALAAAVSLSLVACGDHPVPEHGHVTDRNFTPAWVQWMPGTTTCSGNPPTCSTMPGYPIFWPDSWRVEVTDLRNPDWSGTVEVSHEDYDKCQMQDLWPDCAKS